MAGGGTGAGAAAGVGAEDGTGLGVMVGVAAGGPLRIVYFAVTRFGVFPVSSHMDVRSEHWIKG